MAAFIFLEMLHRWRGKHGPGFGQRRGGGHGQPPSPTNGANKICMRHRLTLKRVLMMVALKSPGVNRGFVGKEIGLRTVQKDSAEEPQKEKVMLGDPRQSLVRKTKRC